MENETLKNINTEDKDALLAGKSEKQKKAEEDRELRENERLKAKLFEMQKENERLQFLYNDAKSEKRKPGIQAVEGDGTYKKRKRENSTGLSDLILPPYTKNRVAIYKIITTDEINPATGLKVDPVDTCIPGVYTLYDKFEPDPSKKRKVVQNVTGQQRYVEDGETKLKDIVEDIIFHRGFLQVNVETDYSLYKFMELHPMNKSNKYRPKNAFTAFERMDIQHKSTSALAATLDLGVDAANLIRKMQKDEIIGYATQANIITTGGRPIHEIRTDLTRWAMTNPLAFYKMNKNLAASVHINIHEAINCGLIEYRQDLKSYLNTETEETLFTHTPAEEPMPAFVKAMCKEENAEIYKVITDRLNYWGEE